MNVNYYLSSSAPGIKVKTLCLIYIKKITDLFSLLPSWPIFGPNITALTSYPRSDWSGLNFPATASPVELDRSWAGSPAMSIAISCFRCRRVNEVTSCMPRRGTSSSGCLVSVGKIINLHSEIWPYGQKSRPTVRYTYIYIYMILAASPRRRGITVAVPLHI